MDRGTPEALPSGITVEGGFTTTDAAGYSYEANYKVVLDRPQVDVADARPEDAFLTVPMVAELTVTNATPGRNLPKYAAGLHVAFTAADYAAIGVMPQKQLGYTNVCPKNDGSCRIAEALAEPSPVGPGQKVTLPLQPAIPRQYMSETQARATVDLFEKRTMPYLIVALPTGSTVSDCTGRISVDVQEQFSVAAETVCSGVEEQGADAGGVVDSTETSSAKCPPAEGSGNRITSFDGPPDMCINPAATYVAEVETDVGKFSIQLDAAAAPKTVNNFVFLARHRYYEGVPFHRVIPGFIVQGGDGEKGDGTGGPGYKFADELPKAGQYKVGSVLMANSGPNTNGSQFFIITGEKGTSIPPNYSLFGTVVQGLEVIKAIEADGSAGGDPKVTHKITKVMIVEKAR